MKAINTASNTTLAENVIIADNFLSRLLGLMVKDELPKGHALLLFPCSCVHTFFMRFPIDAIFLDKNGQVIRIMRNIVPYKFGPWVRGAVKSLEFPANSSDVANTRVGDKIKFFGA